MSVPPAKIGTRASNAEKHPGVPDQKSKRRSPTELAISRAAEKVLKEQRNAAELAAPSIVAAVEDQMAEDDRIDDQNAARPLPVDIPRVHRPTSEKRQFNDLGQDDKGEQKG
jgi:hypothetical protein